MWVSELNMYDFAIVGGGIAGVSVGFHLSKRADVVLLEQESQLGIHSTGRSAAMFMETYGTAGIRALTRASRAFYECPPSGFADYPLISPRGALYVASPGQSPALQMAYDTMARAGRVELLNGQEIVERVPVMRPESVLGGVLEPDAQDIDVNSLHTGFLHGLRLNGTVKTRACVVSARQSGSSWELRTGTGEVLRARVIVNAAGAWADRVAAACNVEPISLQPMRRTLFTFDPPDDTEWRPWPVVVDIGENFYFKPDGAQMIGSPANADPSPPHSVQPEDLDIAIGIERIEAATTMTIRRPRHSWAGLRSFVPDGEMVIGWDIENSSFFWLAAQGGYGIQTAPAVSELAASLALGDLVPKHLIEQGLNPASQSPERLRVPHHAVLAPCKGRPRIAGAARAFT